MELTEEKVNEIGNCLCKLASECHFMYDEAILRGHIIGVYDDSLYMVVTHLRDVLRRADKLRDDLNRVESLLNDLLIADRVIQDSEV